MLKSHIGIPLNTMLLPDKNNTVHIAKSCKYVCQKPLYVVASMIELRSNKKVMSVHLWEAIKPGIRNNGISENYILNILLLYIQSIAFIQYSPRSNSRESLRRSSGRSLNRTSTKLTTLE